MLRKIIFSFLLLGGFLGLAKPPAPPRLPPSERAAGLRPPQKKSIQKKTRAERQAWGFELGTLGIRNNSSGDLLGLQLLFGLRANMIFPLSSRFFLKPSVGYFFKSESEGSVSIFQSSIEAGLGAQYALLMKKGWLWHAGISQKADYLFSRISIAGASGSTPASFRYRVGPSTGMRFRIGSSTDLTFDFEGGVIPFDEMRAFAGFSSGLIFFFD